MNNEQTQSPPEPGAAHCSPAELVMATFLVRWKDRILKRAATNVENHYLNGPVEDQSDEERGFERGLGTAVTEICKLMADPSYHGLSIHNPPNI